MSNTTCSNGTNAEKLLSHILLQAYGFDIADANATNISSVSV